MKRHSRRFPESTRTAVRIIEFANMKNGPPPASLADWSERLKLYGAYVAALTKYKLQSARNERDQSEAADAPELVRAKSLVGKELETQSRLVHKVRTQQEREAALVAGRDQRARQLVAGRPITGSLAGAWSAYWWFESRAVLEAADEIYAVRLTPDALTADNFLDNRDEALLCEGASKRIQTALGLAAWMHLHSYLPRRDSAAQQALVTLFQAINGVAQRTVCELREAIAEIETGAYEPWTGRIVLGIPPSVVAARIEAAGATRFVLSGAAGSGTVPPPHFPAKRPGKRKPRKPSPRKSSPRKTSPV